MIRRIEENRSLGQLYIRTLNSLGTENIVKIIADGPIIRPRARECSRNDSDALVFYLPKATIDR